MLLENLVATRSGSWRTSGGDLAISIWRRQREAIALSRIPVRIANAINARLRRSMTVADGMAKTTARICSTLGKSRSLGALAIAASFMERLKYSMSDMRIADLKPGCHASH